VSIELRQALTF